MSTCNHKWSEETHEGVLSRCCHVCNEWEVELELHALEAELTSTKAAVIDAALIHAKLVQERDEAVAKATAYERDWYEAKSEFGTAAAKLRDQVRELTKGRDELKARLDHAEADAEQAVHGLQLALRNVLMLSHRIRKTDPENAEHLVRFCREAGVEYSVTRAEADAGE